MKDSTTGSLTMGFEEASGFGVGALTIDNGGMSTWGADAIGEGLRGVAGKIVKS